MFPIATSQRNERFLDHSVLSELTFVYWAGGEPLMSPAHKPVMEALIESGRSRYVEVHYTSNLMHFNDKLLADLVRYSEAFRKVSIGASIDGLGEAGEYIRVGWNEQAFFANFERLRREAPRIGLHLDVTLTNLGVLDFPEMLRRSNAEDIALKFKTMEANRENDFLLLDLLAPHALIKVLQTCRRMALRPSHAMIPGLLTELTKRRYRPIYFTAKHLQQVAASEAMRGSVGYFERRMTGQLNIDEAVPLNP